MNGLITLGAPGTFRYGSNSSPALPIDSKDTIGRMTTELSVNGQAIDVTFRIRLIRSRWWSRRAAVLVAEPVGHPPFSPHKVDTLAADALALWQWRAELWAAVS